MATRKGALPSTRGIYDRMAKGHDLTDYQRRLLKRAAELMAVHQGLVEQIDKDGVTDGQGGVSPLVPAVAQLARAIVVYMDKVFPEGSAEESGAEWIRKVREKGEV